MSTPNVLWKAPESWDQLHLGGLAKVKTRVGEKQGKIVVLGQGGQDQLVTIEFDPEPGGVSGPRMTTQAFGPYLLLAFDAETGGGLGAQAVAPAPEPAPAPAPETKSAPKKAASKPAKPKPTPEPKEDPEVPTSLEVIEETPVPVPPNRMTLAELAKASGVSVVSLRKYVARYPSELPFEMDKRCRPLFAPDAILVVQRKRAENWGTPKRPRKPWTRRNPEAASTAS